MTGVTKIGDGRVRWREGLEAIAAGPLEFQPDFPALARRWEAWWAFESPRPLLIASVPGRPDIRHDKAFDILANLRGTERLLMDLYDHPDAVCRAAPRTQAT